MRLNRKDTVKAAKLLTSLAEELACRKHIDKYADGCPACYFEKRLNKMNYAMIDLGVEYDAMLERSIDPRIGASS